MEFKGKYSAEKIKDEENHSKGIFSFMKKYHEKKEMMRQIQPNNKPSIFALFKRKEENMLDKKPKSKDEVTDKLSKPSIFSLFRKKETIKEEGTIEHYKKQVKTQQRRRETIQERRHKLLNYIERAGLGVPKQTLSKTIFNICVLINLAISIFLIYHFSVTLGITWTTILLSIATLWMLVFAVILFALWVIFYIAVDLKIFKRKVDIEEVLPDYLQLTASNIKAGMTIDRALWYAVRPRFGVLAKEIEIVAKETMRGEDLKTALRKFADKYDSVLLKRSISLLIEGIEAGGEIGDLLNKIAVNVQENKLMRKEMSANITTYIIFITFSTIVAAPVLFALAGTLIQVISNLGSTLNDAGFSAATSGFSIGFSGSGIDYNDFRIFAIVSLIITSFFSAIIISTIKSGNAKSGFRFIPIFIVVTVTLFLIANKVLGKLMGVFL
ncbi:type II secretion system F family protein [Candidatus Woesearchaeota archaeon]|nr:type II secretion system F family protein [Candidatus Woesearchaeota archaeon]